MPKITFTTTGGTLACTLGDVGAAPYTIADMQGLSPADATINMTQMALNDGALFNSAKVGVNTLNVAIAIEYQAEYYRLQAYRIFRPKSEIRVQYQSQQIDVWIEGYISKATLGHFEKKQTLTVEIICPFPYWRSSQLLRTEMNTYVDDFHFPFAIEENDPIPLGHMDAVTSVTVYNNGTAAEGFVMTLHATGNVSDPKVYNYITGEFFGLDYSLQSGDLVTIDSTTGQKSVTLERGGTETNIFNYIMKDSVWLTLEPGGTVFTYEVGTGSESDLTVEFLHYDLHTGV